MMVNKRPRIRAAGVLINDDKILFIQHTKGDKKYWLIPGGGIEWGETVKEALVREYKEETNLDIEVEDFLFLSETIAPDKSKHIVHVYFSIKRVALSKSEIKLGKEQILTSIKYMTAEEIKESKIYPNIKKELINILNKKTVGSYLGVLWEE